MEQQVNIPALAYSFDGVHVHLNGVSVVWLHVSQELVGKSASFELKVEVTFAEVT